MNPMFAALKGTAMKDKKKRAAAAGPASVSVATSSSGNYDNAVEIVFVNGAHSAQNPNNFSGGILGGAQSSFGTATSPTRTTQTITAPASAYLTSWNNNGQGNAPVLIGGFIRNNNFTSANKYAWDVASGTILAQSFSTGVSVSVREVQNNRKQFQNNTFATGASTGIYNNQSHSFSNGSGFYGITINHASGRGASTLPQAGDSFSFRLTVTDQDQSTQYTAIHDVIVNFS